MKHIFFLLLFISQVMSFDINCYYITTFIQDHDILLYPETEKRLHILCPTVSTHLVSGSMALDYYDGVVETLLNKIDGSLCTSADAFEEEDRILRKIGLSCDTV